MVVIVCLRDQPIHGKKTGADKNLSKVKKVTYNNNGTDKRNIKFGVCDTSRAVIWRL